MRLLKETAKRMIELCDGNMQGMASTLNLLAYYNDISGGALKPELEILNGMMASKLCEAKNDVKGLDLECRFDEEQVRKSGISVTPRIVLAVMDHMLREGSRQNFTCNDYAIAIYAVLTKYEFYKGSREDFVNMMNRYFDMNVSYDALQKWFARNRVDFNRWNTETDKTSKRQALARGFKELIDNVRTYKSNKF